MTAFMRPSAGDPTSLETTHLECLPPSTRPTRACDFCRRRKIKCYFSHRICEAEDADMRCANCATSNAKCTYEENPQSKSIPKAYIEYVEERQEKLARLLKRLEPSIDLNEECGPPVVPGSWDKNASANGVRRKQKSRSPRRTTGRDPLPLRPSGAFNAGSPSEPKRYASTSHLKMDITRLSMLPTAAAAEMRKKSLNRPSSPVGTIGCFRWRQDEEGTSSGDPLTSSDEEFGEDATSLLGGSDDDGFPSDIGSAKASRFHGKSSGLSLVRVNRECRNIKTAKAVDGTERFQAPAASIRLPEARHYKQPTSPIYVVREQGHPWPSFPSNDLLVSLVDIYFRHINIVWPLLHRPTFEAYLGALRHHRDRGFACVVLALCAAASRYCQDRRVLAKVRRVQGDLGDATSPESMLPWQGRNPWIDHREQAFEFGDNLYEDAPWCSAGWIYYNRCQHNHASICDSVTLTELQTTFLMHQYLLGINDVSGGWVMIGAAIRKAQDRGLHRTKVYGKPSLESELWKRVFWCLVVADRISSAIYGRACSSRDEDADVSLPLNIDDDCWSTPDEKGVSVPLEQPAGRPSYIDAFNALVRLSLISVWASRTLYAIDGSKAHLGLSQDGWEKDVVNQLNQALDEWVASVPSHLKWEDDQSGMIRRTQSANLHLTYHLLQMHIYKYFITAPNRIGRAQLGAPEGSDGPPPSRLSPEMPLLSSSISICTHAARANARVLGHVLSYAGSGVKEWTHLSDVPTLIVSAGLTGAMLLTVSAAKLRPEYALSAPPHRRASDVAAQQGKPEGLGTLQEEIAEDLELLDVCMALLKGLEARWMRATRGLSILSSTIDSGYGLTPSGRTSPPSLSSTSVERTSSSSRPPNSLTESGSSTVVTTGFYSHYNPPDTYSEGAIPPAPSFHSLPRNDSGRMSFGSLSLAYPSTNIASVASHTNETSASTSDLYLASPPVHPSRFPPASPHTSFVSPYDPAFQSISSEPTAGRLLHSTVQRNAWPISSYSRVIPDLNDTDPLPMFHRDSRAHAPSRLPVALAYESESHEHFVDYATAFSPRHLTILQDADPFLAVNVQHTRQSPSPPDFSSWGLW